MNAYKWLLCGVVAAGISLFPAFARAEDDAAANRKKMQDLQTKIADVTKQIQDFKANPPKSDDIVAAQKALADAKAAKQKKIESDEKCAAAQKALADAEKAVADAKKAEDDVVAGANKELTAALEQQEDLSFDKKMAESTVTEMRRRAARDPEIKKLDAEAKSADMKLREAKATSKPVDELKTARDAAAKALEDALKAKPDVVAAEKKLAEIDAKLKDGKTAIDAARTKVADAMKARNGAKLTAAQKAAGEAKASFEKLAGAQTVAETAEIVRAQTVYDAKVDTDPKMVELKKQAEGMNKELADLRGQKKPSTDKTKGGGM